MLVVPDFIWHFTALAIIAACTKDVTGVKRVRQKFVCRCVELPVGGGLEGGLTRRSESDLHELGIDCTVFCVFDTAILWWKQNA